MNYLDGLNPAQKEAVLATEGPLSVLAGAGSGKTRVLATRIYHLIRQGVPGGQILAVTFTNKAAREMRERVRALLGVEDIRYKSKEVRRDSLSLTTYDLELPFVATFHGLGRELLERYGTLIGVPRHFSIYDRADSERAVAEALKALDAGATELSPRAILARISKAKGEGLSAAAFAAGQRGFAAGIAAQAWQRYEEKLRAEKALDFDDLILLPVRLLEEYPQARALAQARWRYLHIDEYQDTNALQGRLANLLAAKHHNLFVVGDIDQCIYTWRGASIENLLEFDRAYPEAKTLLLERNYRSSGTIVEAANAVIEENKNRKKKRSTTENAAGEKIRLHAAPSAEAEAAWVARAIGGLMRAGEAPEEIAVLYRTNFQSRALEEGLLAAGIPYRLLGTRFFERREVKDALAWMRLALEPAREADKLRAAQAPPRGIGKVTLAKLAAGKRGELRASDAAKVAAFEAVVAELAQAAEALAPSAFAQLVVEKSGLGKLAEGNDEERERFENIRELAGLAARHDAMPGKEGIAAFLAESALASDQDEMDRKEDRRGVTLMTVHAAKGLEFGTVFVAGMEEGLFPHGGADAEAGRDEEEERRLFYVAMTRARRRLILTLAYVRKIYGADCLSEPSSFLREIPQGLLEYDESMPEPTIE
ncbi:MAG TPA: UvrD-helicase domain-containing protein [Candidatus Paceibacterota bacterium]|nr:UvrD-helicase domain-containing protein [Candidatus Paceibacterota bacterium]